MRIRIDATIRRRTITKLVGFAAAIAGLVLARNERLRNMGLDALLGSEEEFAYTSRTAGESSESAGRPSAGVAVRETARPDADEPPQPSVSS